MANVTYLLGAGASAGRRDEKGKILEGLPCVKEITKCLENIVVPLRDYRLPSEIDWYNPMIGLNCRQDWYSAQKEVLTQFQQLLKKCSDHSTIDTYAKKLRLRKEIGELWHLEQMLSLFFMYMQMVHKPDSRYDNFLASILQDNLHFPDNIHVLSWNYDSQFEIAYDEYNEGGKLWTIGSKQTKIIPPQIEVLKINGTASFECPYDFIKERNSFLVEQRAAKSTNNWPQDKSITKEQHRMMQLIFMYKFLVSDQKQDNTNLSFAFDDSGLTEVVDQQIESIMENTDVLVIIGYTFPFFNRKIDRKIFSKLRFDADIYIQDLCPERIKQSLKAVWRGVQDKQITTLNQVDQFFLPPEL